MDFYIFQSLVNVGDRLLGGGGGGGSCGVSRWSKRKREYVCVGLIQRQHWGGYLGLG